MAKGKDAELKEARLRVAMSPHNTKLKPWVRAKTYHTPTSSEEDELVVAPKKKDVYYPMTPRRSVKISYPKEPLPELPVSDGELDERPETDGKDGKDGTVEVTSKGEKEDVRKDTRKKKSKGKRGVKKEEK